MNNLAALGLILLLALVAGRLTKALHIPEVTGYIFAGVLAGPYVFGWLNHEALGSLDVFSEVALGLILFSIGSVFEFTRFLRIGRSVLLITAIESVLTALCVGVGSAALGQSWQVSLLLAAIAIETAAASTLMVIRECGARGPLTESVIGLIAVNNIFCLLGFSVVAEVITFSQSAVRTVDVLAIALAAYPLVWQMLGGAALGYLIGLGLAALAARVHEHGELLILLAGCVLLAVGASGMLRVSPLIATLAVGATLANLSGKTQHLLETLTHTDPPLYAVFFVIAGADLNLALLPSLGLLGIVYVGGRLFGKVAGAFAGSRVAVVDPAVKRHLGTAILAQAGLAIGLLVSVSDRFPGLAPTITTVVLSGVAVFELIGPVAARLAISRAREIA